MQKVRQKQVGELIKRNFSAVLQQEGRYIYDDALVTVTNVIMSPDLAIAKIYLSVYNTDNKQAVLMNLNENYPRLKKIFASRMRKTVRRIPNFKMYLDDTLDEMDRINQLLNQIN